MDYQEDYSRRNNLSFDGLLEQPNESWKVTKDIIHKLSRDKVELGPVELERAHRVGSCFDMVTTIPRIIVAQSQTLWSLSQSSHFMKTHEKHFLT